MTEAVRFIKFGIIVAIAALIAIVLITALGAVGDELSKLFNTVKDELVEAQNT